MSINRTRYSEEESSLESSRDSIIFNIEYLPLFIDQMSKKDLMQVLKITLNQKNKYFDFCREGQRQIMQLKSLIKNNEKKFKEKEQLLEDKITKQSQYIETLQNYVLEKYQLTQKLEYQIKIQREKKLQVEKQKQVQRKRNSTEPKRSVNKTIDSTQQFYQEQFKRIQYFVHACRLEQEAKKEKMRKKQEKIWERTQKIIQRKMLSSSQQQKRVNNKKSSLVSMKQ